MVRAYLSIGCNLGDRAGYLKNGVAAIDSFEGISVKQVSPVYRTKPIGPIEQSDFFNAIIEIETSLEPEFLLKRLLQIECKFGRVRNGRWGPRTLDLDIILFGERARKSPNLEIPHPRAIERAFVLQPLKDIAPNVSIEGGSLESALDRIGIDGVHRLIDFDRIQTVGVLGASSNPDRYAYLVINLLVEKGFSVFPVSLRESSILGIPCGRSISDSESQVETVTLYLSPQRQESVIDELIAAMPQRVIFNPGTESAENRRKLEKAGIECVEACTVVMLQTDQF